MIQRESTFPPPRMMLGETLRSMGDTAGAIREQKRIVDQVPDNIRAIVHLSQAYMDAGDLAQARTSLEHARSLLPKNFLIRQTWALLLALEGKREEALQEMDDEVLKYSDATFVSTLVAAEVYAVLGETGKSLDWLEKTVRNGAGRAAWFRLDPQLARIRQEPRFQQILESIAYRQKQLIKK